MALLTFIVKRLIATVFILLGVAAITFFLVRLAPGDPVTQQLGQHAGDATAYKRLYHQMGLDLPLWRQFVTYIWNGFQGNFGTSVTQPGTPVTSIIGQGLPVTLELGALATIIALVFGIPFGVLAAVRHNRIMSDNVNMGVMMTLYSLPPFVIIPGVWLVFGILLKNTIFHLPVTGWQGLGDPHYWLAPAFVYAAGLAGFFARSMRSFMLEELTKDYIRTARAKGMSERTVIYIHALKNTMLPFASVLGPTVAFLVVGAFIIEQEFSIPGIANITVQSTLSNDYAVTLATTLVLAAAVVVANALTDIIYTIVDPRVRL
ncbi:MAG: binding-protein-dependent transport system inner rane component [Chloroflexi bacterium]|nr:binding-protein-dependent transport system inner rane component [Chloroflexota bacterium]